MTGCILYSLLIVSFAMLAEPSIIVTAMLSSSESFYSTCLKWSYGVSSSFFRFQTCVTVTFNVKSIGASRTLFSQ